MEHSSRIGQYLQASVAGETYRAYLPQPLPPNPPLDMSDLYRSLDQAQTALGRLDGMSLVLPDPSLFIYMYVRKEAVLSSQIEGTQSSLSDLLLFESEEAPGAPLDDVREVSCYVAAMNYGLQRLHEFPMSLRLIREIHAKLMTSGRGSNKQPGEFRTSQNWIGGSRPGNAAFVPPPPEHLMDTLGAFELFLHDETVKLPVLIKAALAHLQFETIHPFLDGNGRLGRLLITFILCSEGLLKEPLLYLSLYFKKHRQTYYHHLQNVRETGDWESWVRFFLDGVAETAQQATETAQQIIQLFAKDRATIESSSSSASLLKIYNYFQKHPISNSTRVKNESGLSLPTVLRTLSLLEEMGIIREITGRSRHKLYSYSAYFNILDKGTEPFDKSF